MYTLINTDTSLVLNSNNDLRQIVYHIYSLLINNYAMIDNIVINVTYFDVVTSNFNIKFDQFLYLTNTDSKIKIFDVYPEFACLDLCMVKKYIKNIVLARDTTAPVHTKPTYLSANKSTPITNLPVVQSYFGSKPEITPMASLPIKHFKSGPETTNLPIIKPVIEELPKELKIFEADKKAYNRIKLDIQNDKFEYSNIHPQFMEKFCVMEILDNRGVLNFDSDTNTEEEYIVYKQLFDSITSDDVTSLERLSDNDQDDLLDLKEMIDPDTKYTPHNAFYKGSEMEINFE